MKPPFLFILLISVLPCKTFCANGFVASDTTRVLKEHADTIPNQTELGDVAKKLFRIKKKNHPDSSKADKNEFVFAPAIGYSLPTGINVIVAMNLSFNKGLNKETRLSSINSTIQYSYFNKQIIVPLLSSIWTKNNIYNCLGDARFMIYPTETYGLGGQTSLEDARLVDYSFIKAHQSLLKKIGKNLYAGMGYALDLHYNMTETKLPNAKVSDFETYNKGATRTVSSGALLNLVYDGRKNSNNPQESAYASILFRPNLTFLGSDGNWQSLLFDVRKYIRMPTKKPSTLAFWTYNWFTFGKNIPYFDLPSTGWDKYGTTGRGYIQSRFRGNDMLYIEAEYRFTLTKNGLLGGVVFANAESITEVKTKRFERILPATGLGIRIKANKASNVNLALDYGFGIGGSRGLFVTIGEVF
jgi:hypothetical protein